MAVAELGQLALECSSLPTIYKAVSSRLTQLLSVDRVGIMEVDESCRLVLTAGTGWSTSQFGATVAQWDGMAPHTLPPILRSPVVDESVETPPTTYGVVPPGTTGVISVQTVPVGKIDGPIGAIGVYYKESHQFSSDELALLKSMAQVLASAIERSRAEEHMRRHGSETAILGEIARIIGSSLEIDDVYPLFVEQVARLLHFDRITVSTIDLINNTQRSTYYAGVEVPEWTAGPPAKIDGRVIEAAVRGKVGMIIQDENLEDFQRDYPRMDIGASVGLRSMLTTPVIWNGEVINMLTLRSKKVNAYHQRDLQVATRIAAQIAGALANSKLHHEQMEFAEEQATLAEISRIIASSARIDEIYPRFAETVRKLIPFDRITITTINEEFSYVISRYVWGMEFPESSLLVKRQLQGTLTAAVARARSGMIISAENILSSSKSFSYLEPGLKAGLQSAMGIPLIFRGRVIGAILLRSLRADAYTQREMARAERVATQISGIVWNAQLQEELEQTVRTLVFTAELSTEMIKAKDFAEIFERVHEKLAQSIQFDRFAIGMFDAEHSCLKYEFVRGVEINGFTQGETIFRPAGASSGLWADLMMSHRGGNFRNGLDPEGFMAAFNQTDLVSWLQAPLGASDRPIGVISLRSVRPDAYSQSDLLMLERIAQQVTLAIENVRHWQQSQEIAYRDAMFSEMLTAISSHGNPHAALQDVVALLRNAIPADRIVMTSVDTSFEGLANECNTVGTGQGPLQAELLELNSQIVTEILVSRDQVTITDAPDETGHRPSSAHAVQVMHEAGYRSILSVPLMQGNVVRGVLHFYSSSPDFFSERFKSMALRASALLMATFGARHDQQHEPAISFEAPVHTADTDKVVRCSLARRQLGESDVAILKAVAKGLSNSEIATHLNFAPGTIKNRLARIYKVFDVSDRAAAMVFAIRCGIVD